MIITLLSDNNNYNKSLLSTEHGLSMYIEYNDKKILCDMGASDIFANNAKLLNINPFDIDFAFVSHAHSDHSGGLTHFLDNSSCKVFLSKEVFTNNYYSIRQNSYKNLSIDKSLEISYYNRYVFINSSYWIDDKSIAIVKTEVNNYNKPIFNKYLYKQDANKLILDDFAHELSLVFNTSKGLVIISSCSHQGVGNIVESCKEFTKVDKVYAFVGGLHIIDSEFAEKEAKDVYNFFKYKSNNTRIYSGHCTGLIAKNFLVNSDLDVSLFHVGKQIII